MIREARTVNIDNAEIRSADDGSALKFSGHAAVFNERTWIGPKKWGFYEEVDAGFFDDVLEDNAAFLVNHDPNIVLARNPTTMTFSVDERGLVADADWDPSDPDAVKWAGRVRRGDVSQMSFAFTVAEEKWSEDEAGNEIRTLLKAERLYDASLVTYPAYEGTDGGMRDSVAEVVKRHRGEDPRTPKITVNMNGDTSSLGGAMTRTSEAVPAVEAEDIVESEIPTAAEVVEEADGPTEPVEETPAARSMQVLRHHLIAARHNLPL